MMKNIFAYTTFEILILFTISGISSTPINNSTSQFQLQITANETSSDVNPVIVAINKSVSGGIDNVFNSLNVSNELLPKQESQRSTQTPVNLELASSEEISPKVASEVGDLLKRNSANDTSSQKGDDNDEDDSDEINDTILVNNPNVKDEGKTHDEDSKVDTTITVIDTTPVSNDRVNSQYLRDNTTIFNNDAQLDTSVNLTRPDVETSENRTIIIEMTKGTFTVSTESVNTIIRIQNNSYDYDKMKDESQITGCGNKDNNKEVNTSVQLCNSTTAQIDINSTTGSDQKNNSANNVAVVTKVEKEVDIRNITKEDENLQSIKSDVKPKDHAPTDEALPTKNLLDTGDKNSLNFQRIENKKDENLNSNIKTDDLPETLDTTGELTKAPPSFSSLQHEERTQRASSKSAAFLQPTESAAILAGVFVAIALFGYVGLLVWRRILEKRYGNREMLVNEDDFYDTSDLKHFEL